VGRALTCIFGGGGIKRSVRLQVPNPTIVLPGASCVRSALLDAREDLVDDPRNTWRSSTPLPDPSPTVWTGSAEVVIGGGDPHFSHRGDVVGDLYPRRSGCKFRSRCGGRRPPVCGIHAMRLAKTLVTCTSALQIGRSAFIQSDRVSKCWGEGYIWFIHLLDEIHGD